MIVQTQKHTSIERKWWQTSMRFILFMAKESKTLSDTHKHTIHNTRTMQIEWWLQNARMSWIKWWCWKKRSLSKVLELRWRFIWKEKAEFYWMYANIKWHSCFCLVSSNFSMRVCIGFRPFCVVFISLRSCIDNDCNFPVPKSHNLSFCLR